MSPTHNTKSSNDNSAFWTAILYGVINTIMVTPISISFCAIIFRDAAFEAYMPKLVKLVLISCAVHQLCFSLFSSLPFAIGQVQDAGLIFLSAIAADIAHRATDESHIVPTTLYILGICTAILGVMLIVVAKLKLASMVQYLPMPVIGGYLAFIGFFCGEAGLAMMAGVRVSNIMEWGNFLHFKPLILLTPGVICGISTYMLLRKFRSPLILPLSLVFIFVTFYGILWTTGYTLEEARDYGWIAPLTPTGSTFEAWTLYNIYEVEWWHFPRQIITLIAMFFVVAFSSSLDVAAIEMELGVPLDYNRELNTVGISNMVSGLCGGYTGSYIFSQTIFTMRRGVTSRVCGYFVIAGEVIIALLPICITAYIPKMFFGSLLVLIATDLMYEWLWEARAKMMLSEYLVCMVTFVAIQMFGIEIGMCIGILGAMTSFVITYSKLQSVSAMTLKSSTVIRSYEERAVLLATRGKVLTISMGGYIFFGSAVKILEEIKSKLEANNTTTTSSNANNAILLTPSERVNNMIQQSTTTTTASDSTKRLDSATICQQALVSQDDLEGGETDSLVFHSTKGEKVYTNTTTPTKASQQQHQVNNNNNNTAPPTPSRYNMWMRTPKSNRKKAVMDFSLESSSSTSPTKYDSNDEQKPLLNRSLSQQHASTGGYGGIDNKHNSYHHNHQQPLKFVYSSSPPTQSHLQNHMKTVYELSPNEIKAQHDTFVQSLPHTTASKGITRAILSEADDGPVMMSHGNHQDNTIKHTKDVEQGGDMMQNNKSRNDNYYQANADQGGWVVGDELSLSRHDGSADGSLNNSTHSQSARMPAVYESTTPAASAPLVKNSPSLLNLVWEGQAHRRERLRSVSDMGLDSSVHSVGRGTNGQSSTTATNNPNLTSPRLSQRLPADFQPVLPSLNDPSAVLMPPADSTIEGEQIIEYLVLDFSNVSGVDATAARSCFLSLVHLMKNADVTVVFANVTKAVEDLLRAHHVIDEDSVVIPVLDDALEWCEDQLLTQYRTGPGGLLPKSSHLLQMTTEAAQQREQQRGHDNYAQAAKRRQSLSSPVLSNIGSGGSNKNHTPNTASMTNLYGGNAALNAWDPAVMNPLCTILEDYLEIVKNFSDNQHHPHQEHISKLLSPQILIQYFQKEIYTNHQIIFDVEEPANKVYFIESGQVEILTVSAYHEIEPTEPSTATPKSASHATSTASSSSSSTSSSSSSHAAVRINKVATGGVFGESDFFLGRTHSVRACAVTDTVIVWTLNKQQFIAMEIKHPQLCMLIQYTLLKSLSIASTCAMYALHPTTANAVHDL